MLISFVGFFDAQINVDCDDADEETSAGSDEGSAKGGSFSLSRSTLPLFPPARCLFFLLRADSR